MSNDILRPNRRRVLASLGAVAIGPLIPHASIAAESAPLFVRAESATIDLSPGHPASPVWQLSAPSEVLRVRRGAPLELTLTNGLPAPIALSWRGPAAASAIEPLLVQPALAPGASARLALPTSQAGTGFCDIRLLADTSSPNRLLPVIIDETDRVSVDRDEVFLIEDWRVGADGTALPPARDAKDAAVAFTVNGRNLLEIRVRSGERVRLRFINGCQRAVVAVKFTLASLRVMAIDGQPAEPFEARNGALVLAPGARTDALIDIPLSPGGPPADILLHDGTSARPVARLVIANEPPARSALQPPAPPLPANGLPDKLDLKSALRVDLPLDGPDWALPARFTAASAAAFRAKAGRIIVLTLTNRSRTATVFHLHGHHVRLLDRLDDGWKPYWLDTLALQPGETQRVAFAAQTAGRFLLESMATDWGAPRLLRWYEIG